jgi:DNA-binding XRE family transcriptional regulator
MNGSARTFLSSRVDVMDQWDFKKWRKKLGINQIAAGEMLGLSRGAVQDWESEIRPVPRAVELACLELLRRWKQRPEFGPVTLLYAEGPMSRVDSLPSGDLALRCEPHPDNKSALARAVRLRETVNLLMPFIVEGDGTVIWSSLELLHECDAQKGAYGERSELDA